MKGFWQKAEAQVCGPLRALGTVAQGIVQKGGIYQLACRAFGIYRREGIKGIRRGVAHMRHMVRSRATVSRLNYAAWIQRYDTLGEESRLALTHAAEGLPVKPRISVLMPVYNPVAAWLEEAIESVRRQIYPNWELCIADDASTNPDVIGILHRYKSLDPRIKVAFRDRNGHISAASNTALALAEGEWVALLDHDDLFSEHALFWLAEAVNRVPDAGIIYSDEDKITERGVRRDPYFKCDWNPELFLSQNMICHLGAYRLDLVHGVGGFREGFEGAQDYDLALRCTERLVPSQIIHVPRVLYHWRVHAASTAKAGETKPYALLAGEKALGEHLKRRGIQGVVTLQPSGLYRTRLALPDPVPRVSVIIPVDNGLEALEKCVNSIVTKTAYENYEILIVSAGIASTEATVDLKRWDGDPRVRIVGSDGELPYAAACNLAVKQASGEFVALLDGRIEAISADWLEEMVAYAAQPGIGAVGARLLRPDGTIYHAGMVLGIGGTAGYSYGGFPSDHPGYFGRAIATQCVSAVAAECLLVRKSIYMEVGSLNELPSSPAALSADFCIRIVQAGYRNIYASYARLYRHGSGVVGMERVARTPPQAAGDESFKRSWAGLLGADPAYNPNLTLKHEDFSYAWPPRVPELPTQGQWSCVSCRDVHNRD